MLNLFSLLSHHTASLQLTTFLTFSETTKITTMKFTSTRNASIECSFEDAICSGYAPDGGLFVPSSLPEIKIETLKRWSSLSYPNLAYQVMRMFISTNEIPNESLEKICHDSFSKGFEDETSVCNETTCTIPIKKIGSSYMVELFHGPTFCFKDFG